MLGNKHFNALSSSVKIGIDIGLLDKSFQLIYLLTKSVVESPLAVNDFPVSAIFSLKNLLIFILSSIDRLLRHRQKAEILRKPYHSSYPNWEHLELRKLENLFLIAPSFIEVDALSSCCDNNKYVMKNNIMKNDTSTNYWHRFQ